MPNARTHDTIGVAALVIAAPLTYAGLAANSIADPALLTCCAAIGHAVGTYWLSPDLDLDSAIDDRWGPLRALWAPYRWVVPHRHWLSHSGVSALLRVVYIVGLLFGIAILLAMPFGETAAVTQFVLSVIVQIAERPDLVIAASAGLVFADLLHCAADAIG